MTHRPPAITVSEFLAHAPQRLELRMLTGADENFGERQITDARVHKLGLALAGFPEQVRPGRVQIVGESELWYLNQFDVARRREAITNLALREIACVVITKDLPAPAELLRAARENNMPLLSTPLVSSVAIGLLSDYLQEMLATRETRHGALLELYGLGVLIEGRSGIGKSECALDLISRGHRLVSDDMVEVRRVGADKLLGSAPELLREHLEIRGLGIINIKDLFGGPAISGPLPISLSIKLERWDEAGEVDRLGVETRRAEILGVSLPHFLIPVTPGRNLSTLVETAVRVHLLKLGGRDAARRFVDRHQELIDDQWRK